MRDWSRGESTGRVYYKGIITEKGTKMPEPPKPPVRDPAISSMYLFFKSGTPAQRLVQNPSDQEIASAMEQLRRGELSRLVVNTAGYE
jgi:hypothetical protein